MFRRLKELLSGVAEADRPTHWVVSVLAFLLYFPLVIAAHRSVGNVALAVAFIPVLTWAPLLGPRLAMVGSILLAIPNYYLFIALDAMSTDQETLELVVAHLIIGTLAYIVGYGYVLRRELSRQLEERQKSDARFRGLFEKTSDGVFFLSVDLKILDLNEQAASMMGYRPTELLGRDYYEIVEEVEREDVNSKLQQVLSGAQVAIFPRSFRRKDGSLLPADVSASLIYDRYGGVYHVQSICRDVTERKAAEAELFYKATHDGLTGLANRAMFFTLLDQAVETALRHQHNLAVLFLDLDGFKKINDTHGHAAGDQLLIACGARLVGRLRSSDLVARMGGDEFAVLLVPVPARSFAEQIAQELQEVIQQPMSIDGGKIQVATSVGISMFPEDAQASGDLVKFADQKMYVMKKR